MLADGAMTIARRFLAGGAKSEDEAAFGFRQSDFGK
jgi:hypothetical protein